MQIPLLVLNFLVGWLVKYSTSAHDPDTTVHKWLAPFAILVTSGAYVTILNWTALHTPGGMDGYHLLQEILTYTAGSVGVHSITKNVREAAELKAKAITKGRK